MKAPEKIQIHLIKNDYDAWSVQGYSFLADKQMGMTEYTRTDAFIEKAAEFMCNNIDKQLTIYHNNTWRKRDEFIEAFRRFMKGE